MLNPMAILLTAYRTVIWGTETGCPRAPPDFLGPRHRPRGLGWSSSPSRSPCFKRVEPAFARIL